MIPKIIHYCWFGGNPLPPLAVKCIASWKKYFPDYEIKQWDESNFDVNMIPYTTKAYIEKKYAFVSDYARFWIIYHYGGIYFDTDVEVIKPMNEIILKGAYMGFERNPRKKVDGMINPGLGFAAEKNDKTIQKLLEYYSSLNFQITPERIRDTETIVQHTTKVMIDCGLKRTKGIQKVKNFYIYPSEYFAPIHFVSHRLHITNNTYTIHQYMASWMIKKKSPIKKIKNLIPEWFLILINRIKHPEMY